MDFTYGAGAAQAGGGYAGMTGPQNQTQKAKQGLVVRDASGKVLSDLDYRTALGRGDKLSASWESEPEAPQAPPPVATDAPVAPPVAPPPAEPVDAAGGGTPALHGLRGAMRDPAAGWADESMSVSRTAGSLGLRTPPQAVTTLSEIMRRFGRTY